MATTKIFPVHEDHDRAECVYIQLLHGLDECSDEDDYSKKQSIAEN